MNTPINFTDYATENVYQQERLVRIRTEQRLELAEERIRFLEALLAELAVRIQAAQDLGR